MNTAVKVLGFLALCRCLNAADYNYMPGSPLQLGAGFDKLTPLDSKTKCIDAPEMSPPIAERAMTIDIHQANRREDLYRESQVDLNLSASAFGNSASYKSSLETSAGFSEQDLVWILSLTQTYDSPSISVEDINAHAKAFWKANGLAAFYRHCGTEYVAKETRASSLFVFFTLHTLDTQAKSQLSQTFSANASYAGASINFGKSFRDLMTTAISKGVVDVKVAILGKAGFAGLASLSLNSAGLDKVKTEVESYIKDIAPKNAVPISYTTGLFSDLIGQPAPPNAQKLLELQSTYSNYANTSALFDRVDSILTNRNTTYQYLTDADIAAYQKHWNRLYAKLVLLRANAAECQIGSTKCHLEPIDTTWITWPESREPHCSNWKPEGCGQCTFTIGDVGPFAAGKAFPFSCTNMVPGRPVDVLFDGYVTSAASNENVVENANVYVHLDGIREKDGIKECAAFPAGSSCSATKTDGLRTWTHFKLAGWLPTQSGTVTTQLVLDRCAVGNAYHVGCEFSPPGVGTTHVGDGVVNGGMPPGAAPPSVTITVR